MTSKGNYGPSTGYSTEAKKSWRDLFWWHISRIGSKGSRSIAKIFLIDSAEGLETRKALKLGFRPYNIFICNGDDAVCKQLDSMYPQVCIFASSAREALAQLETDGVRCSAISLDFCASTNLEILNTLIQAGKVVTAPGIIALNRMRGREMKALSNVFLKLAHEDNAYMYWKTIRARFSALSDFDKARHQAAIIPISLGLEDRPNALPYIAEFGAYRARRVTMGWEIVFVNTQWTRQEDGISL